MTSNNESPTSATDVVEDVSLSNGHGEEMKENGCTTPQVMMTPTSNKSKGSVASSSSKKRKKGTLCTPGSSHKSAWETFKQHLSAFYARECHVNVPQKHKEGSEEYNLGRNMTHIRCNQQYIKNHPERRAWLDELGFTWKTPRANKTSQKPWQTFKSNLLAFYEREGHTNVPLKHKEGNYNLGRNVSNVRSSDQYIMNHPERRAWLGEVNFEWELRRKRRRTSKGSSGKKKSSCKGATAVVVTAEPVDAANAAAVTVVTAVSLKKTSEEETS